jgi:hypothetical protein
MVARAMQKKKESGELDNVGLGELNKTIEHVQLSCAKKRIGQLASNRDYSKREAFQKLCDDGFGNTVVYNVPKLTPLIFEVWVEGIVKN